MNERQYSIQRKKGKMSGKILFFSSPLSFQFISSSSLHPFSGLLSFGDTGAFGTSFPFAAGPPGSGTCVDDSVGLRVLSARIFCFRTNLTQCYWETFSEISNSIQWNLNAYLFIPYLEFIQTPTASQMDQRLLPFENFEQNRYRSMQNYYIYHTLARSSKVTSSLLFFANKPSLV